VYGGSVVDDLSFFGLSYETEANTWHPLSTFLGAQAEKLYKIGLITGLVDSARYVVILGIFLLAFYLVLCINKQKAKSSVVELGIIPLFASAWLQVLSYNALGYSAFKEWYWIVQPLVIVLTLGTILGMLFQLVKSVRFLSLVMWSLALWYGVSSFTPFSQLVRANMTYGEWAPNAPNNDISAFLEAHTEPGSVIGLTGGGNAGYFVHDRTVINMDGLINSYEYFQLLQDKKAGAYLGSQGMDYVLANLLILDQLPYRGQFTPYLEFTGKSYGGKYLMRYHAP
jgi:hypothetical protein